MIHAPDSEIGREIMIASANVTVDRYMCEPKYRILKMEKFARSFAGTGLTLAPSSLTGEIIHSDWIYRRIGASVYQAKSSLPHTALEYLDAVYMSLSDLTASITYLTTMNGHPDPRQALEKSLETGQIDDEGFDRLLAFTKPIATPLAHGVADQELFPLLRQAADEYKKQPDFKELDPESEAMMVYVYGSIYPIAEDFLDRRGEYTRRKYARLKNWF